MAIQITATDVVAASTFLETLLSEKIPAGRFTQGTVLRDITINALSFIFAQIRKDNSDVRALQSLLLAPTLETTNDPDTSAAVADAVDAILSNWFISRNSGNYARGNINIYVSRYQDYILPPNTRFVYDRNRAYVPDVEDRATSIIIRANQLQTVFSATTGAVEGFYFTQRVIATKAGTTHNIPPSVWATPTRFSPFVTRVVNPQLFTGGTEKERTTDLIARASTAITVRNLINERSITTVLKDKFSAIKGMQVIGYGDPEMQRDRTVENATGLDLHVGGHYDVYVELPRTTLTFSGPLGGAYRRPDNIPNIFKDDTITDWTTTAVRVGDAIRITAGIDSAPRDFTIQEIRPDELHVSVNAPFPVSTEDTASNVTYYIYRPLFGADTQILPASSVNTTGITSSITATANRLILPGGAHYRVIDVAVINPDPGDPFVAADGYVYFPVRTSNTPAIAASASNLQYRVLNNNPATAQSMVQYEELELQPSYNNKTVRVRYESVAGLDTIASYVTDRFERILCANPLVRAYNPVYISCVIPWKIKPTATSSVNLSTVNNAVVNLINNFDRNDILDVSDIVQVVKDTDPNIGTVYNFTVYYDLVVPDGRVIRYASQDIITIDPARIVTNPVMDSTLSDPLALGISDRTIRYMTSPERITFQER